MADLVGDVVATVVLAVEANGGVVKDIAGDGVLALFDAPGDAGRAAVAVLAAIDTEGLSVRVGAAVGSVRSAVLRGAAHKVRVVGPAIDEAVSLEGRAEPGTALVSLDLVARTAGAVSQPSDRAPRAAVLAGAADVVAPPPLPPRSERAISADGAVREERRTIVALFAAVARSAACDGDEDAAVADALATGVEIVERFGGTVKDLAGDVIVALFGAPLAHDDDAERAILTGLALCDGLARDGAVDVRVGIASGRVVVGTVGAGHRVEYGAVGDAMNTAARLEAHTEPGLVVAAEAVCAEVEDRFEWGDRREVAAKGKREPVRARRVVGPARAAAAQGLAEVETPALVGREHEIERLIELVGERSTVVVFGDAGVGKSALVRAAAATARRTPWLLVRGASWDRNRHLGALGPLLDGRLRLDGVTRPDELEAQARTALLDALRAASRGAVDALVVEDAQWVDDASLRVVLDVAGAAPMGVVLVARPEGRARVDRPDVALLEVGPLPTSTDALLLEHLVGRAVLPWDVERRLLEASGGNPLFLHAQVQALEAAGSLERTSGGSYRFGAGATPVVSGSVERLMIVQVDGLDRPDRAIVDALAVLGGPSSIAHVAAVAGSTVADAAERLPVLAGRGLVADVGGDYDLAHSLARDTAYNTILKRDLRRLHRRAADALAGGDAGRGAWHRWHADQPSEAARLAVAGAEDAKARLSYLEAAALFDLAGRAAERSDAPLGRTGRLWLEAGAAHLAAAALDDAMEAFARASALALDAGDATTAARAAIGYEDSLFETRRLRATVSDRGRRMLDAARAVASTLDGATHARLLAAAGRERRFADGAADAAPNTDAALALARSSGEASTLTYVLTAWRVTREAPDQLALRSATDDELIASAVEAGDAELEFEARRMVLLDQLSSGRLDAAWRQIDVLVALGDRLGERRLAWLGPMWRAMRLLCTGPIDDAAVAVDAVYEEGRRAAYNDVVALHALQEYLVRRHQGTAAEVGPAFRRATDLTGARWDTFWASLHVELDDLRAARLALDRILADPDLTLGGDRIVGATVAAATDAVVALRDTEAAALFLERLLPWRGHQIVVGTGAALLGPADHTLGRLVAVLGDGAAAEGHHRRALDLARDGGGAIAVGECALGLASWAERAERVRLAAEARSIGETAGSYRLVSLADRLLRSDTPEESR